MRTIVSTLIFFVLLSVTANAQESTKTEKISPLKSQKHETIQTLQKKDVTLDAFEKLIWETDMDLAFQRAKKENKNVMIMVEDTRCKWCKNMKVGALSDPKVQAKLQPYILLKVQRSDKDTSKRITEFTGAIPSFYFMEPDQELYESIVGYFATEDFLQFLIEIEEDY
ncbi:MAG TPA: thioredoxin family protein [Sulfurovum sp.]